MAKESGTSKFMREFVSEENRKYKVHLGSTIASSLAGIVCGAIIASIIWFVAFSYLANTMQYTCIK